MAIPFTTDQLFDFCNTRAYMCRELSKNAMRGSMADRFLEESEMFDTIGNQIVALMQLRDKINTTLRACHIDRALYERMEEWRDGLDEVMARRPIR